MKLFLEGLHTAIWHCPRIGPSAVGVGGRESEGAGAGAELEMELEVEVLELVFGFRAPAECFGGGSAWPRVVVVWG